MKDVFDFKSQLYRESEGKKLISVEGRIETWGTYREVCLLCAKCCTKYICKCSHWIHFSNPLLHSKVAEAHLKVKLSQGHPAGEMIELGVESKWIIQIKGKGELWEIGRSWDHISAYLAASGNY